MAQRQAVEDIKTAHGLSERRACRLLNAHRSMVRYAGRRDGQEELRLQIRTIAAARPRFGYRRVHAILVADGYRVNHKRVQRLYREDRLQLPRRRGKKRGIGRLREVAVATQPHQRWHMDFVSDSFADGRRFRALTIVDAFSRFSPGIEVATSLPAARVLRHLDRLIAMYGRPEAITVDNGPEFTSRAMIRWARALGIQLDFIDPGRPMQNGHVESFNGKFRDECLSQTWFTDIVDATQTIEAWRVDYNTRRPHSSLGNIPPQAFLDRFHAGQLGHVA
jgi:putative transposase